MSREEKNDHTIAYFKLLRTASGVEQKIKIALQAFDLTHAQLNVLASLVDKDPKPMYPNEIKENLVVNSPDVTRLIDRLCKKGLVSRTTCLENRRMVDIRITLQGKNVFLKAHAAAKSSVGNYFKKQITKTDAKELSRILDKLKNVL